MRQTFPVKPDSKNLKDEIKKEKPEENEKSENGCCDDDENDSDSAVNYKTVKRKLRKMNIKSLPEVNLEE